MLVLHGTEQKVKWPCLRETANPSWKELLLLEVSKQLPTVEPLRPYTGAVKKPDGLSLEARFKMLHEIGVELDPALSTAIAHGRVDAFLPLINAGANPNTAFYGYNALHCAAWHSANQTVEQSFNLVQQLAYKNVPLEKENFVGVSALGCLKDRNLIAAKELLCLRDSR